jgi:16S rRNA pseudouridine516 synthase
MCTLTDARLCHNRFMSKPLMPKSIEISLERLLQAEGHGTRRACRALIEGGQVQIDALVCVDPEQRINPLGLSYTVAGEAWVYHAQAYVMLHKPAGYECSQKPRHHLSVYDLLPAALRQRGVQSVGRLDEDTTGLLLFSDDGQFIHRMAAPKWKVNKVYRVGVKHPLDAAQIQALQHGVVLHDEPQPIAAVACVQIDAHTLDLTLAEGKYHQVKRMLAAVGNRVEALHRSHIGDLALPDDLKVGEWRWLNAVEVVSVGMKTPN